MKQTLDQLLQQSNHLWRGRELSQKSSGQTSGFHALDKVLPERGWPKQGLIEIINSQVGVGELQLILPLIRQATQQQRYVVFIRPPYLPYPPALQAAGVDLRYVLLIKNTCTQADGLWCLEKMLLQPDCDLALGWFNDRRQPIQTSRLRRLQLAAESGQTRAIYFLPYVPKKSHAPLRLSLNPGVDAKGQGTKPGRRRAVNIQVLKARGSCLYQKAALNLPLV